MQNCKMCKFFEEKLSANVRACQQLLNNVDCGVYTVANAFQLLSGVNLSAKKIWRDQIRPHVLKCHKSGDFNEFSSNKQDEKAAHCQEKRLNLMYFAIADFHEYGITTIITINLNMVQCDSCQNWYHRKSENILDVFNAKPSNLWHCLNCKNNID